MKVLIIILAILFIIALIPLGATAIYDCDGAQVYVKVGFFKMRLYPMKPEKAKSKKEKPEKKKGESEEPEEEEKGGSIMGFKDILSLALKAGSRFKKALTINHLTIHFTAASKDAFTTAMEYGAAWTTIGIITGAIENNFKVKQSDLQAFANFTTEKPTVYAKAALTIRVWQIMVITFSVAREFLKLYSKNKKKQYSK